MFISQKGLAMLLLPILVFVGGCVQSESQNNSFCLLYAPVITSPKDSEATRLQVDENEVVYACLCQHELEFCGKGGI